MGHVGMDCEMSNAYRIAVGMYCTRGKEREKERERENEQEDLRTVGKILVY